MDPNNNDRNYAYDDGKDVMTPMINDTHNGDNSVTKHKANDDLCREIRGDERNVLMENEKFRVEH